MPGEAYEFSNELQDLRLPVFREFIPETVLDTVQRVSGINSRNTIVIMLQVLKSQGATTAPSVCHRFSESARKAVSYMQSQSSTIPSKLPLQPDGTVW